MQKSVSLTYEPASEPLQPEAVCPLQTVCQPRFTYVKKAGSLFILKETASRFLRLLSSRHFCFPSLSHRYLQHHSMDYDGFVTPNSGGLRDQTYTKYGLRFDFVWVFDPRSTACSLPCGSPLNLRANGHRRRGRFHPLGWLRASALTCCLISLDGVK